MEHAASLDLASYENPTFHDRLERARVQATDRLGMIQAVGRVLQQVIVVGSFRSASLCFLPGCY
jgi:ATP-binding cassette subfamily B protein